MSNETSADGSFSIETRWDSFDPCDGLLKSRGQHSAQNFVFDMQ